MEQQPKRGRPPTRPTRHVDEAKLVEGAYRPGTRANLVTNFNRKDGLRLSIEPGFLRVEAVDHKTRKPTGAPLTLVPLANVVSLVLFDGDPDE